MANERPIIKNTLHAGQKYIPIANGSKVSDKPLLHFSLVCDCIDKEKLIFQAHFHFQTWKLGKERVLLDDSKKIGKKEPMILVIGHKFKLEIWESIIKLMAVGEVASFRVKKDVSILTHNV